MNRTIISITMGALLTLGGCATSHQNEPLEVRLADRNLQQGEAVERIQNYRINGWNALDEEHLIIETGPSERYLVTLMTHCAGLRSSETVGFSTTTGGVTRFDDITVSGPGGIVEECPIKSIHRLTALR